jgi:short-subunit dehydrogenase
MKFIVTGTSSGLGFCIAQRLILIGNVLGVSRSLGKAHSLINSNIFSHISYDFSLPSSGIEFQSLVHQLRIYAGNDPITIVLNAANFYSGPHRLSDDSLKNLFEINVFSLMHLVQSVEVLNLRRILIINSISGLIGQPHQHEYSASKHAVMGFSRSLAKSAKNKNYDVMCINPGGMITELWNNYQSVDCSDFLLPEVVADITISLITIPQRIFIENMVLLPPSDL